MVLNYLHNLTLIDIELSHTISKVDFVSEINTSLARPRCKARAVEMRLRMSLRMVVLILNSRYMHSIRISICRPEPFESEKLTDRYVDDHDASFLCGL